MTQRVMLSWSSGKDSAWTLHRLRQDPSVEVVGLLTTLNSAAERVAMHATRREILQAQGRALGLPVQEVGLPWPCSNVDYEAAMREALRCMRADGVTHLAFGDLFLGDVRAYRETLLAGSGIEPLFPIWGEDTRLLAQEMVRAGLKAILTCVDPKQLSAEWVGRPFDQAFLDALPAGADPCGEHGEFHSCVYAGPMFARPLDVVAGEIVHRDGFVFADVCLRRS